MGVAIGLAAVVWLLPVAATVDALSHPATAWRQAGRRRWFWATGPAALLAAALLTGSLPPLFAGAGLALVYFGRARDAVAVAHGLSDLSEGRRPLGNDDFEALAPAAFALPFAGLAYVVALTARRPLEALVGIVAGLAALGAVAVAAIRWRRLRHHRPPES